MDRSDTENNNKEAPTVTETSVRTRCGAVTESFPAVATRTQIRTPDVQVTAAKTQSKI
jgi:hypothetical protein